MVDQDGVIGDPGLKMANMTVTRFDGAAVEIESLDVGSLKWVVLPDLQTIDEAALRKAHTHVLQQVFDSNGIERMSVGGHVLEPLEQEMKRRGIQADYWSREHKLRSDLALVELWLRGCDAAKQPDRAAELESDAQRIRDELVALHEAECAEDSSAGLK